MYDDGAVISRSSEVVARNLREQTLLLDMRSEQYLALNAVAGRVWSLLDGHHSVADLTTTIAAEYDAPIGVVRADITALLSDLAARGLVKYAA